MQRFPTRKTPHPIDHVMTEILLFISAFMCVFALGFQSLNVNNGHFLSAMLTSFVIGISHICLYKYLPDASLSQLVAYLLGGPLGITSSMWAHRRIFSRRRDSNRQITEENHG